jgi:hypothetical protein
MLIIITFGFNKRTSYRHSDDATFLKHISKNSSIATLRWQLNSRAAVERDIGLHDTSDSKPHFLLLLYLSRNRKSPTLDYFVIAIFHLINN